MKRKAKDRVLEALLAAKAPLTIDEVAKLAGCSHWTAAEALRGYARAGKVLREEAREGGLTKAVTWRRA